MLFILNARLPARQAVKHLFLAIIIPFNFLYAQIGEEHSLAQQYYQNGEYDKAAALFEKLYEKNPSSGFYYKSYYQTLMAMQDFKSAEKLVKKQMKNYPDNLALYVDLGIVYKNDNEADKASKSYDEAIKLANVNDKIALLGSALSQAGEYDKAIITYLKGQKLYQSNYVFSYELATVYQKKGAKQDAISSYLDFISFNQNQIEQLKAVLQTLIQDDTYFTELKSQLYKRIQKEPENPVYPDLLIWQFVQKNDYASAFIQAKALDKRLKEDGSRVLELGRLAKTAGYYDEAINMYTYVLEKGKNNIYYIIVRKELLTCEREKILSTSYLPEDMSRLKNDYQLFLDEFGVTNQTLPVIRDFASLYALNFHQLDSAIILLEKLMNNKTLEKHLLAQAKLDLGDYYVMQNEVWEATLLYSQVDKAFKDEPISEEAKFRNARLSYFMGEFEWAQAQLDVLKASTSELIANDAMELSVFIIDHYRLDTTTIPMQLFAEAALLQFQNRDAESVKMYDSVIHLFPGHGLTDDVYYQKAQIEIKKRNYEKATVLLKQLLDEDPTSILKDDALFQLGNLFSSYLNNKEEAFKYYEEIIFNHKGSVYAVEARKRYRSLRGDVLN